MMELILKLGMAKLDCVTARQTCFYGCFVVFSSYIHTVAFIMWYRNLFFGLSLLNQIFIAGGRGRMRLKKPIYGIYELIPSYQRDGFVVLRRE